MSLSKNPNAYLHTKPILDAAVMSGGGTYTLLTHKDALRWRAMANAYRLIISKDGPTNYDALELTVDNNKVIFRTRAVLGQFTTEDGTVIEIDRKAPEPKDELLEIVKGFALEITEGKDD
jgi:hypothetical protein